jgi:hypothetical protein
MPHGTFYASSHPSAPEVHHHRSSALAIQRVKQRAALAPARGVAEPVRGRAEATIHPRTEVSRWQSHPVRGPAISRLKRFTDATINRVRTTATDRYEKAYRPDEKHIFVATAAGKVTSRQMHK